MSTEPKLEPSVAVDEPNSKRRRIDPFVQCLNKNHFDADSISSMKASYAAASPYPHCVVDGLFNSSFLAKVRGEVIDNFEAKFKETDLFKVLQTLDLGNLGQLSSDQAAKVPSLLLFRDFVYSDKFRHWVEQVTGCGELNGTVDCSINVYVNGCHLLCHDDVISSRRVSFIIYLTEEGWEADDGGALELYPQAPDNPGCPATRPAASQLPLWNRLAMFTVEAGRSFHAVQEVFSADKHRLSVQGWFHSDSASVDPATATLQQLKRGYNTPTREITSPLSTILPALPDDPQDLTPADISALKPYINATYLTKKSLASILQKFDATSSVQLHAFFTPALPTRLLDALSADDSRDAVPATGAPDFAAGVRDMWVEVGPTHVKRYLAYQGGEGEGDAAGVGQQLHALFVELLSLPAFAKWLALATGVRPKAAAGTVRRFRPGLDYTVAHGGVAAQDAGVSQGAEDGARGAENGGQGMEDGDQGAESGSQEGSGPVLDLTYCLVDDRREESAMAWHSDEFGGFQCYTLVDEEMEGPAEVYQEDEEEGGNITCSAVSNVLNVVLRDDSLMKFVKYVSKDAPGSRVDVTLELEVDVPEGDDEVEDGEEPEGKA